MSTTEPEPELAPDGRPTTFRRGDRLGKFQIQAFVARGGMGEVYKAWDSDLNRSVAVKTLLAHSGAYTSDPQFRERFRQEARTISHLEHENVVRVLDLGEHEGLPFIVMSYLEGQDLQKRLAKSEGKPLAPEEAVEILLGACRGVDMCHRAGIVHRDLKPGNLFLTSDQETGRRVVKVLDFGVAKPRTTEGNEFTMDGLVLGTPSFMPPEQARGLPADARSDQYALGSLLYACLTLRKPYEHVEAGLTSREERVRAVLGALRDGRGFPTPRRYRSDIPELLEGAILRAMSAEPEDRFPSVLEFSRELLPYAPEGVRMYLHPYYNAAPRLISSPQLSTTLQVSVAQAISPPSPVQPVPRDPDLPTTKSLRPKAAAGETTDLHPLPTGDPHGGGTAKMPPDVREALRAATAAVGDHGGGSAISEEPPTERGSAVSASVSIAPDGSLIPAAVTIRDAAPKRGRAIAIFLGVTVAAGVAVASLSFFQHGRAVQPNPEQPSGMAAAVMPSIPPRPPDEPRPSAIVPSEHPSPKADLSTGPDAETRQADTEGTVAPNKPAVTRRRNPVGRKRARTDDRSVPFLPE